MRREPMEIVIDAGHGGNDLGNSANNIIEKDYALKISNYQYDRFNTLGIPVSRTRSTDITLTPEERAKRVLNAFGNKQDVIVISNHLSAGGGDGAEIVYALRNDDNLSRIIAEELAKVGQNVRKWYQRRLQDDPSKDYYFIIRETGSTQALFIEYGFVDSKIGDDVSLLKNHWKDLAEAVVKGVTIYGQIPYDNILEDGVYTVEKGDTLWSIAKMFNVSVSKLKDTNNLKDNMVYVNQKLKIPNYVPPKESNTTYVVQKGDNLYSIAEVFKTTPEAIKTANNLKSSALDIGQILKIPNVEIIVEPEIKRPSYIPPLSPNTYTVQRGDSLYSIASKFGVTIEELRNLNNLTSDVLTIGQMLMIPVTGKKAPIAPSTVTYVVQRGDSLWTIAQEFGTTPDEIKRLNKLTSNILTIGQELIVPVKEEGTAPPATTYTVKRGDSLWTIAQKFDTNVNELKKLNNLSTDLLHIGQEIIVPA
jgi:LysM repeat protein/N-acetylmuramoyl-L-alanine amidase